MDHVVCPVSPVACHYRHKSEPLTLPLLTPSLCTDDWHRPTNQFVFQWGNFKKNSERKLQILRSLWMGVIRLLKMHKMKRLMYIATLKLVHIKPKTQIKQTCTKTQLTHQKHITKQQEIKKNNYQKHREKKNICIYIIRNKYRNKWQKLKVNRQLLKQIMNNFIGRTSGASGFYVSSVSTVFE